MAHPPTDAPAPPPQAPDDRLDSWKQIATYLKRDVSTVQRWEHRQHLPIRRHRHGRLGSVYAFKPEIDAWLKGGSVGQQSDPTPLAPRSDHAGHQANRQLGRTERETTRPALAVLPFANINHDADDEYFADGLADELISALSQVSGLSVIARTSAFAFKGQHQDIRTIAEALGVTHVVEGSVRRAGTHLRVIAQLIRASDGTPLWSERYDRALTEVFAVQDEIVAAIIRALRMTLSGPPGLVRPHEPTLPAYDAVLKARYQLPSRSLRKAAESSARAEGYFKQAMILDPLWAEPHAALGHLYFFLGRLGLRPLGEMVTCARAEAEKALALLPSEPTSHAVLGAIAASHDYDWTHAREQFELATASASLPSAVHDLYAMSYLSPLGRFPEAIAQLATAIAHDPLNMLWRERQLMPLVHAELYGPAMTEARQVLEFEKTSYLAHHVIALAHFFEGRLAEARAPAETACRRAPWSASATGFLAGLLALTGEPARAMTLLDSMRGAASVGRIFYHLMRAEVDAAIDWYERAVEQRQPMATEGICAGFLRPLRGSPRWPNLVRRMNLPVSG